MDALLTKINELYGLQVSSLERVTKGFLSENHVLSRGDQKFFLKRYRFNTQDRVEDTHLVKKYFFDGGIPVIFPLTTQEGDTFFSFDNRYYALFPFINDKQFERGLLTDEATISLGKMLGKIHLLGREAKLPIREKFKGWDKEKFREKAEAIDKELKKKENPSPFDVLAQESISLKRKLVEANSISYEDIQLPSDHLIHGDYLAQNVFFDQHDHVSYVFDFEKADYSPRTYELFRSLVYDFLSGEITEESIGKAKLYLNSYLEVYPISQIELSKGLQLFYLKSIHGVWVEEEHYLKGNDRVDEFLLKDVRRLQYFSEHYEELEKQLLK